MPQNNSWILRNETFNPETYLHTAPTYTIGNGLFCCRGFMEEEHLGIAGLGGIYMAEVFGQADYQPWRDVGRELVNIPNFFSLTLHINQKLITLSPETITHFCMELDMENGILRRSYTYEENHIPLFHIAFERFASHACIYTAGQQILITPLCEDLEITADLEIRTDITNLNMVSSEPYPLQPGKKQYHEDIHNSDLVSVTIPLPDRIRLAFFQKTTAENAVLQQADGCCRYVIKNKSNVTAAIQKLVSVSLSPIDGPNVFGTVTNRAKNLTAYQQELSAHKAAMAKFWEQSDVIIEGNDEDQLTIRYNIFQLASSCPSHTNRCSIGARGLTGEMYEGSVFWDTEIFMLPFFSLVHPTSARKLLEFRYHTLPEAKIHAASNWFEGAMYGWQVNTKGVEQTPQGVGAYYSIHVIADISYGIIDYWNSTKDKAFMLDCGLEILIETARFWKSRLTLRQDGYCDILAVRGPNEYGVIVDNNLYTNMMARENFILCRRLLADLETTDAEIIHNLKNKVAFTSDEAAAWQDIEDKIVLPFDEQMMLWLEDDTYLRRKPIDMKRAKPTARRIIDTTIPYEALPFYQVSKQADVLHLMKNLPRYFTKQQIEIAYRFYQPRTAFDSSLTYSMFALIAARLGKMEEAAYYYEKSSQLDIKNVQLNTISGLHLANFGGTWQALIFGFCGIEITPDQIRINPHLPEKWNRISFRLCYQEHLLLFHITACEITLENLSPKTETVCISSGGTDYRLEPAKTLLIPISPDKQSS